MVRITECLSIFSFSRYTIRPGQLLLITANHFAGRVDNTSESSFIFKSKVAVPSYNMECQPSLNHFKNVLMNIKVFFNFLERKIRCLAFLYMESIWSQNVIF